MNTYGRVMTAFLCNGSSRRSREHAILCRAGRPVKIAPPGELTRREFEIARLIDTGMTNREIAKHLHVSHKTVEVHLSRILAKLGVPTRSAVESALARADNGG
ncbi:DNA-binding NarL/FixJ family response regulator [Kibdelosporangium banguiense]|uniref:DNA-binding NarL/FixJ family response regulator n=1 Tax=Kibdelosporangium banguiense TaxID=1365924 RepID=A0ABS4TZ07_9PSEU|nr:helix-turn-helix transcriptional regulator [Kibdelosporangium banguiense]MBP2329639.1 DNA-binding NarL/FixJ family response regulator [Kibdelosporangium banguiense]